MLSRIAESMFWIGRYVERAEDTARLLQTHLRMLIEDTTAAEVDACRNLLALMNVDHVKDPRLNDLLRVLGYDPAEPTSIYFSYDAARDNARRAREVIPLDLWECVITTWHQLPTTPFGASGAHVFLNWVRERSAMFAGISRSIMVRDDGWEFMSIGRSLEQVDMTSRLVATAAVAGGVGAPWTSTLRACGAYEAGVQVDRGGCLIRGPGNRGGGRPVGRTVLGTVLRLRLSRRDGLCCRGPARGRRGRNRQWRRPRRPLAALGGRRRRPG